MKNLILISILLFLTFSCTKTEQQPAKQPAKSTKEALARLAAVRTWKISAIKVNGKSVFENGVSLIPDKYDSLAEWMKFDISKNEIEVKYPEDLETSLFKFTINEATQLFSVMEIGENGKLVTEELFTIKSGSVYADSFELEAKYDNVIEVYTLVPSK